MSDKVDFSRLFRRLVEQHGDAPALINTERDRRYSYRQLHALTNRIANMVREDLSLGEGDRYLLILENDNLSLMHVWTILKGTASAVFTNFRDPLDEHLRIAEFVKPKCVFVEASMAARYAPPLQAWAPRSWLSISPTKPCTAFWISGLWSTPLRTPTPA